MAKKKDTTGPANRPEAGGGWVQCAGYELDVRNGDAEFIFELDVVDADANGYFLRVKKVNDRTALIQRTLRLIADRWSDVGWHFQADADGSITDVR